MDDRKLRRDRRAFRRAYVRAGPKLQVANVARTHVGGNSLRIQPLALSTDEPRLTDAFVHDSVLGVDCAPTPVSDGVRCLPAAVTNATTVSRYLNADCTEPVDVVYTRAEAAPCTAPASFMVDADGTYRRLSDAYDLPLYERLRPGTCASSPPPSGTSPRLVGPSLPAEAFTAVTIDS